MHFVLQDHDAKILSATYDKRVTGVKLDCLAVSRKAGHQIGSSSNRHRPSRELVERFEDHIIGKHIEIVIAVNKLA